MVFEWERATRLGGGRGTRAVRLPPFLRGLPAQRLTKTACWAPLANYLLVVQLTAVPLRSCRADRRNDAFSPKDKTGSRSLRRGVRARAELKTTCSVLTVLSPAAKRRRPQRRRRALVAPPQRRLPRGERRRRPPTRVRRGKKETATGAVEPGQCTKGRGREAALRRRPATYWSRARIPGGGRARALRIDP